MSRKLGLAHLTLEEASLEDLVAAAAETGFSAIGMRICGFAPEEDSVGLLGIVSRQRALRRRMDDTGISMLNVCSFRLSASITPADYAPVIDACAELGAPIILLTCFVADPAARSDKLAALAERAGRAGIRIGLEFFRSSELRNLAQAEALRRSNPDHIGHIMDALHFFRAGHCVADLASLDPGAVFGIQICDGPALAPSDELLRAEIRDRRLPGEGELPLSDFIAALPAHLPLEIECPVRAHAGLPLVERARRAWQAGNFFLNDLARGGRR